MKRLDSKFRNELDKLESEEALVSVVRPRIINSLQKFKAELQKYPELRLKRRFSRQYHDAINYYEKKMVGRIPTLVQKVEQKELQHIYEEAHSGTLGVRIESIHDVDVLLEKYPQEKDENNFFERYRHSKIYFEVRDDEANTQKELAAIHGISQRRISEFQSCKEPTLILHLRRFEEKQTIIRWLQSKQNDSLKELESYVSKMDAGLEKKEDFEVIEQSTNSVCRDDRIGLKEILLGRAWGLCTIEDVVSALTELYQNVSKGGTRICYTVQETVDIEQLHQFVRMVLENSEEIKRDLLNIGESGRGVRIGVVDKRLYLWIPDLAPNDMINVWSDQYFYFNKRDFCRLVLKVGDKLGLTGSDYKRLVHLNRLVNQMISTDSVNQISLGDYRTTSSRMKGEILHLLCDILGVSPRSLEKMIEKVTGKNGHGGFSHPNLLQGEELEILRARLGAVINSDCWLGDDGRLQYTEVDIERIRTVQKQFRYFGDIDIQLVPNETDKSSKLWILKPMGCAFIFWGFTTGDKPVQNKRLVESIREGSLASNVAYLEDLIPEDGSFDFYAGFRWSRTVVINPGVNDSNYTIQSKLAETEVDFLVNIEGARRDKKNLNVCIPISCIEKQSESEIARSILNIIEKNRSRLIDDEVSLAERLGIEMRVYPEYITKYEDTGRISLKWVAKTKSKDDAIKWALLAPPNSSWKNQKVRRWLTERSEDVASIKKQLQSKGLLE